MAPSAEALLLATRDELERAETLARTAVTRAENETDNVCSRPGRTRTSPWSLNVRAWSDYAELRLSAPSMSGNRKGCLPWRTASANKSHRSTRQQADGQKKTS